LVDHSIGTINAVNSFTHHQSKYWATLLSAQGNVDDSISRTISSAKVDMNPHQVEGATFAIRSPLSKGVILADEVGLGKTIEAGLVIAQRWAERRRKILLIVPASLRKQWAEELLEKFSIRSEILDAKTYGQFAKNAVKSPFEQSNRVVICSYQFAAKKAEELKTIGWDLAVFDEAHKLRNVYLKNGSKMAKVLTEALLPTTKLLLTATPLQNNLMELFGLVSVIDPHFFGSDTAFKQQYGAGRNEQSFTGLRQRLSLICYRSLRRQIQAEGGIHFKKRVPLTQDFTPSTTEKALYDKVSAFLQRDGLSEISKGNKVLLTLVIRKILASSSFAIAGTLEKMIKRLEEKASIELEILDDYETADDTAEDFDEDADGEKNVASSPSALKSAINELKSYQQLAQGIQENAKGKALVDGLQAAFTRTVELGGNRKAVIFTESCRTQAYLADLLTANGYEGQIIQLNGSNSDTESQAVYKAWLAKHNGTTSVSGSKSSDMKAAIVDSFRNEKTILISTESGAEGINLQFCSLLINYDLPWNPQRVEQRIGRCHRYGQKSDVVVLNFVNQGNKADQRVYELLKDKFKLFEGVFGASDEILGAIESGVDIEKRIFDAYQLCTTVEESEAAFAKLQEDLDEKIQEKEGTAYRTLIENFDEDVHRVLKTRREKTRVLLDETQRLLLNVAKAELGSQAKFDDDGFSYQDAAYFLDWHKAEEQGGNFFHINDEALASQLLDTAKNRVLSGSRVVEFDYEQYGLLLSDIKPLVGQSGWMMATLVSANSYDTTDRIILACKTDDGVVLDKDQAHRLLLLPASEKETIELADGNGLDEIFRTELATFMADVNDKNLVFFNEENEKLERWADESKEGLLREIKDMDADIRQAKKASRILPLAEKLAAQKQIKAMENKRDKRQLDYFESRRQIEARQDALLDAVQAKLNVQSEEKKLFLIRWKLV